MRVIRDLGIAVPVGAAVGVLAALRLDVPLLWAVALGLPAAAVAFLAARLSGAARPNWTVPDDEVRPPGLSMAATLASRLADAGRDPNRYVNQLRPRLQRIALTSLQARPELADLTALADPRARDALGADLHTLLIARHAALPAPQRTAQLLAQLEDL